MEFILGCNYWASHAGTRMWQEWSSSVVDDDLKLLGDNGVSYLRVFPLWSDFQPVIPLFGSGGLYEYRLEGDIIPDNPYFIDMAMMKRFEEFCAIAKRYHIKLITALITGWMSGRAFMPPALYSKNLITDPTALMFEQKFIKGFVGHFANEECIYAWDLGNECNCLGPNCTREEAYNWTAVITNAIKACDNKRKVISGMHGLDCQNNWTIQDQGEITDMLTTHPYPFWVKHCNIDAMDSPRTLFHATAQTIYYSAISHKPCLVEEIGTMGPMVCSEETAGRFMRLNLFSNYANGAKGLMWWCAHDQSDLAFPPYDWKMCERELGMVGTDMNPKPSLSELHKFSSLMNNVLPELPPAAIDAVCILTKGQDNWGVAYMTYILSKKAGINITFSYIEDELPPSDCYLLPSIRGTDIMPKHKYDILKQKIHNGATLYVSLDDCFLTEFEKLTSIKIMSRESKKGVTNIEVNNKKMHLPYTKKYNMETAGAKILAKDTDSDIIFSLGKYGEGKVYMLSQPMEKMLLDISNICAGEYHQIYKTVFNDILRNKIIITDADNVCITEHISKDDIYCVCINYSNKEQKLNLKIKNKYRIGKIIYGNRDVINPCDALIIKIG